MKRLIPNFNSSDFLYFFGLILVLFYFLSPESQYNFPSIVRELSYYLGTFLLTGHMLTRIALFNQKEILFCLLFFIAGAIAGYNSVVYLKITMATFLIVCGAKGISYKEILKTYFCVGTIFALFNIVGSTTGFIKTLQTDARVESLFVSDSPLFSLLEAKERNSFGYGWPTNFANHIFYILSAFILISSQSRKIIPVLFLIIGALVLRYTDSRLAVLSIWALAILPFLNKTLSDMKWKKLVIILGACAVPIFGAISYLMTYLYDRTDIMWFFINGILSGRLRLGQDMLDMYGSSLFGQYVKMYSNSVEDGDWYNYIDSSYLQLIIIMGLIYTMVIFYMYIKISYNAITKKIVILYLVIVIAGITGIICQHFIQIYMNPLLIAFFADLNEENQIQISCQYE